MKKISIIPTVFTALILFVLSFLDFGFNSQTANAAVPSTDLREAQMMILDHLVYRDLNGVVGKNLANLDYSSASLVKFKTEITGLKWFAKKDIKAILGAYQMNEWTIKATQSSPNGFYGATFYNSNTGEYVVSFRGTEPSTLPDLKEDTLSVVLGKASKQLNDAKRLVDSVPNKGKLTVSGHSLGGYISQLVAINYNVKAVTFNSPGFYKGANSNVSDAQWANDAKGAYDGLIRNYSIYLDKALGQVDRIGYWGHVMGKRTELLYAGPQHLSYTASTFITFSHDITNFYYYFPVGGTLGGTRKITNSVFYYDSPYATTYNATGTLKPQTLTFLEIGVNFDAKNGKIQGSLSPNEGLWYRVKTADGRIVFVKY